MKIRKELEANEDSRVLPMGRTRWPACVIKRSARAISKTALSSVSSFADVVQAKTKGL